VTRNKNKKRHIHEESSPSKKQKKAQDTPEESDDQKQQVNTDKTTHNDSDSEDEGKVWREGKPVSEEKSRDEEFQEYLEELLL
jgi:hypothetical protein